MSTTFRSDNRKGIDHSEDVKVDGRIILKLIMEKINYGCVCIGFAWLGARTGVWRL
jgi:hypothetical protein